MKKSRYTILTSIALMLCLGLESARAADPSVQPEASKSTADLIGDLKKTSQASSDPQLKSLGDDLGSKSASLSKSLGNNPKTQAVLQSALTSVLGNRGPAALNSLQQLSQAKLTPEQTGLAKDVYHTGSAFLVQKNLGSVEGSQTEVAQVVSSLRKGNMTGTVAPLKSIGQNSKLTQPQKDFVSSLTDHYAPGLKKAGGVFKSIPGLSK